MPPDVQPAAPVPPIAAPPPSPPATPPAAPAAAPPAATPPAPTAMADVLGQEPVEAVDPTPAPGEPKGTPPEGAEFKVTLPEGYQLDSVMLEEAIPLFKEMGITPEQASKLATIVATRNGAAQEAANEAWATKTQEWVQSIQTDKEVGGADWQKKVSVSRAAAQKYGGAEFGAFLKEFPGIGAHPALVKAFYRVGLRLKEDSLSGGTGAAPGSSDDADLRDLYKNSPDLFDKKE